METWIASVTNFDQTRLYDVWLRERGKDVSVLITNPGPDSSRELALCLLGDPEPFPLLEKGEGMFRKARDIQTTQPFPEPVFVCLLGMTLCALATDATGIYTDYHNSLFKSLSHLAEHWGGTLTDELVTFPNPPDVEWFRAFVYDRNPKRLPAPKLKWDGYVSALDLSNIAPDFRDAVLQRKRSTEAMTRDTLVAPSGYTPPRDPTTDYHYLATLINPVDQCFYEVWKLGNMVALYNPDDDAGSSKKIHILGQAYWDRDDPVDIDDVGVCVRSHSPAGVRRKGVGFGLLLYSGLALSAFSHRDDRDWRGIYSTDNRSESAQCFWERQVDKGLASESVRQVELVRELDTEEIAQEYLTHDAWDFSVESAAVSNLQLSSVDVPYVQVIIEGEVAVQYILGIDIVDAGFVYALSQDEPVFSRLDIPAVPAFLLLEMNLSNVTKPELVQQVYEALAADEEIDEEALRTWFAEKVPAKIRTRSPLLREAYDALSRSSKAAPKKNASKKPKMSRAWKEYFGPYVIEPVCVTDNPRATSRTTTRSVTLEGVDYDCTPRVTKLSNEETPLAEQIPDVIL